MVIIIFLLVSYLFYKQNAENKCENDKEIINIKIIRRDGKITVL